MKQLLFGRQGQLGHYLAPALTVLGEVKAYGRAELDLADATSLRRLIISERPKVIVNAAAYTAVDQAETDADAARKINVEAPQVMAEAAKEIDALLVHYSTDYVFDGERRTPYDESAPTHPLGVYGRTKLAGEEAIRTTGCAHLILRTAWLYSGYGKNFLKTMLRLAAERDELRVVADQIGSPTYARVVSDATTTMLARMVLDGAIDRRYEGIYHVTCDGEVTWHGFATQILSLGGFAHVPVRAITSAEYPTPVRRPAYSVLDHRKLKATFGIELPSWDEALRQCMMEHGLAKQR